MFRIIRRAVYWLFHSPREFAITVLDYMEPFLPDKVFVWIHFWLSVGYPLSFRAPRSYNEKLQWLKFNDIHSEYSQMVDKVEAKKLVASKIGEKYLIPTLGVWDRAEDIDWEALPNRFVIKPTSDSGSIIICKDKSKLNIPAAISQLSDMGARNYSRLSKEYPYQNVSHRYIAEEYIEDESGYELKDYKIFCFNGKAKFLFVATGRHDNDLRFDFFDIEFNHLPFVNSHENADICPIRPENFEEMIDIAEKLSAGIPHVRVDLYNVHGKIYFGEWTFFHNSGMYPFFPKEWDYKIGDMLTLP